MPNSAALFRAANLRIMDYPFQAAIDSALSICDEVVVVVGQSEDDTLPMVCRVSANYPGRITIAETQFHYDRTWQEKWWALAASLTDAEWLMYHDADEVIHEDDAAAIKAQMAREDIALISFPFIHFYMTPRLRHIGFPPRATRIGRRSVGWKMVNWCTDANPHRPACQMVWQDDERSAHGYVGDDIAVMDTPIYHYSWCRDAVALQISQCKHVDWYRDGDRFGLTDGRIPDVGPYPFERELHNTAPYEGGHPAAIRPWLDDHESQWAQLESELLCSV